MIKEEFFIGNAPVVLYGGGAAENAATLPTDKEKKQNGVFICVHGQGGNKEEAERFAKIAAPRGYGVLSVDLPDHGKRTDGAKFVPWEVVPELSAIYEYAKKRWNKISLRATSIGAYFSLLAFRNRRIEKRLLVSPLLDMQGFIDGLMRYCGADEARLKREKEIKTESGQTLSYEYFLYAKSNPVRAAGENTYILYADGDTVIPKKSVEKFAADNRCELTVLNGFEHWLHTEEEVGAMEKWEKSVLSENKNPYTKGEKL